MIDFRPCHFGQKKCCLLEIEDSVNIASPNKTDCYKQLDLVIHDIVWQFLCIQCWRYKMALRLKDKSSHTRQMRWKKRLNAIYSFYCHKKDIGAGVSFPTQPPFCQRRKTGMNRVKYWLHRMALYLPDKFSHTLQR